MEIFKMNNLLSKTFSLDSKESWRNFDNSFSLFGDICFSKQYQRLYETKNIKLETFWYQDSNKVFAMSYLKSPILDSEYYDFQTPYGYSGPLSNIHDEDFLKRAWESFYEYCRDKNIICGFIRFNPIFNNQVLVKADFVEVIRAKSIVIMQLNGRNEDEIFSGYAQDNRNKIRKAIKNRIEVKIRTDVGDLMIFKEMYHQTMSRNKAEAFYYFDEEFFRKVDKYLNNNYRIFTAYCQCKPIGGALVFFTNKILYYFLSATAETGKSLGAANLLRHIAVKFAKNKNIEIINFGGGRIDREDDPLLKFKKGFSGKLSDFYIGKVLIDKDRYEYLCKNWQDKVSGEEISKHGSKFLKYRS